MGRRILQVLSLKAMQLHGALCFCKFLLWAVQRVVLAAARSFLNSCILARRASTAVQASIMTFQCGACAAVRVPKIVTSSCHQGALLLTAIKSVLPDLILERVHQVPLPS